MPMISVRDNEINRCKSNAKKRQKKTRGYGSHREKVRAKWFCYEFKLGFVQVICKASLIFNF